MPGEPPLADDRSEHRRRHEMLDFTDGTVWFLCGLAVTVLAVLLCGVVAAFGMRSERNTLRNV
jgi:hypothetical protein